LTQLAAASNRGLLPSPSFAFDGVRTPPEELVNSASPKLALRFRGARSTSLTWLFPGRPGLSCDVQLCCYPPLPATFFQWTEDTLAEILFLPTNWYAPVIHQKRAVNKPWTTQITL